ncbi:flagellar hook assembly protein FlgD [Blastococcus saxobsidens]|uniref:flagellar hook assembly protein FlgD n=1 Tax=Blastococcus saxobsidens TaxID=138336 RepID=UPI001954AEE3|nr:flagellar hook capping FlgD N-terminal domain-containing protein [Blastococcus saxobsidens]
MPDAVSGTAPTVATNTAKTSVDRGDQMGKDTFLKLLVAQMKFQDPSNPADTNQMMSQTATFTQVEKLSEIAKQNASMLALQRSSAAGAMVGQTITYTDDSGAATTGVVSSVRLGSDKVEAVANVDGRLVPLGRITHVGKAQTTAG